MISLVSNGDKIVDTGSNYHALSDSNSHLSSNRKNISLKNIMHVFKLALNRSQGKGASLTEIKFT